MEDVLRQSVEPRFVSAAYFLRFTFDPGQYALAGRESLDGRDVLRIEYYPTRMFAEGRMRPNRRIRERDTDVQEKMNKSALVTLWVDQAAHQILRYEFTNVDLDFLPARALVRVDATRRVDAHGTAVPGRLAAALGGHALRLTLATGAVKARYDVEYHDYRLATVTTVARAMSATKPQRRVWPQSTRRSHKYFFCFVFFVTFVAHTVFVSSVAAQAAPERIAEIRVHGNHTTPDADILTLSGLTTGEEASEARLRDAERKLRDTGRFEGVELRRRYVSIADPSQILIMIVVDEHPAVSATDLTPGPMKKFASASMWLPILRHEDGYGMTYGARVTFKDALGDPSRVSVPLSWGGERRVAIEGERAFDGPISVVRGALSLDRRVNPHFELPDTRREARVEAERTVTSWLRVGAGARLANVRFGDNYDARHTAGGVHAVFDTRIDPSFPRNAVHARLGWERLAFQAGRANRWLTDVRGYVGIGGSTVLALRGQLAHSQPPFRFAEQSLLGGSGTLRGYRTGYRAGDGIAALSAEVRLPLTSPLSVGRFGVKAFADLGTTWAANERLSDQRFDRGVGGGVYVGATASRRMSTWHGPSTASPRVHVGIGLSF